MATDFSGYATRFENPYYCEHAPLDRADTQGARKPLPWQARALLAGRDARYFLVQAFCGSGKSLLQVWLAIDDVIRGDYARKQLIVVPQTHIHRGFAGQDDRDYLSLIHEGREVHWRVSHNYCRGEASTVKRLRRFLAADAEELSLGYRGDTIGGLTAVATHQTLVAAWGKMDRRERDQGMRDCSFRVDECHHIKGVFHDDDGAPGDGERVRADATLLGTFCRDVLDHGETAKLHLTTATFYRGDRHTILSEQYRSRFASFCLPWEEHWKHVNVKDFSFEYRTYDGDPIADICRSVAAEPAERHLIIVPSTGQRYRDRDGDEVARLIAALREVLPPDRVLDLVDPAGQKRGKERLLSDPASFDAVVACGLFNEGTDWVACSRLYNTVCEKSVTLAVQRIGRVFRRWPGKKDVRIIHYVPAPRNDNADLRTVLSDRFNAFLLCVQLDAEFRPIEVPAVPTSPRPGTAPNAQTLSLVAAFGERWQDLVAALVHGFDMLADKSAIAVDALVRYLVAEYPVPGVATQDIVDGLKAWLLRRVDPVMQAQGIDIAFVRQAGFDVIWPLAGRDGMLLYATNRPVGAAEFRRVREIYASGPGRGLPARAAAAGDHAAEAPRTRARLRQTTISVDELLDRFATDTEAELPGCRWFRPLLESIKQFRPAFKPARSDRPRRYRVGALLVPRTPAGPNATLPLADGTGEFRLDASGKLYLYEILPWIAAAQTEAAGDKYSTLLGYLAFELANRLDRWLVVEKFAAATSPEITTAAKSRFTQRGRCPITIRFPADLAVCLKVEARVREEGTTHHLVRPLAGAVAHGIIIRCQLSETRDDRVAGYLTDWPMPDAALPCVVDFPVDCRHGELLATKPDVIHHSRVPDWHVQTRVIPEAPASAGWDVPPDALRTGEPRIVIAQAKLDVPASWISAAGYRAGWPDWDLIPVPSPWGEIDMTRYSRETDRDMEPPGGFA